MSDEQIYFTDLSRMFIGEVPLSFFIEAFIRILFVYILLVGSMRLMGSRMSSILTRNEMVAMVVMAAAIGIPVLSPARGLIPAIIIAVIVVVIERAISALTFRHQRFEKLTQGDYAILVKDGVMQYDAMQFARITRERLVSEIRATGLKQMGGVKRLYFEAEGTFTIVKNNEEKPGLTILPDWDKEYLATQTKVDDILVCHNCGREKKDVTENQCNNCGKNNWVQAVE